MITASTTGAASSSAAVKMLDERGLDAADHRADRRRVEQRHEVVGAVRPWITQASPPIAMKIEHADERVEPGRRIEELGAGHRVDERAEREPDQRVEERAGDVDRGEEHGDREREGEADDAAP